jgi:hypothetical protein
MKREKSLTQLGVPKLDDPSPLWSMGLTIEELIAEAEKRHRKRIGKDDETTPDSEGPPDGA